MSINDLAKICGVSNRTARDWQRGKFTISKNALLLICGKFDLERPNNISYLNDYWYVHKGAQKGALRRAELYGQFGTTKGRRKGGLVSQARRKANPDYYCKLGCIVRNKFNKPILSTELAEFVGILLGDGSISDYQATISLDRTQEIEYARYVCSLIRRLFCYEATKVDCKYKNTVEIKINGINFVNLIKTLGLKKGNKVKNGSSVPNWIKKNEAFSRACVRGLYDTDGGLYTHKHWVNGIRYQNLGWTFTNFSPNLLIFVRDFLNKREFKVKNLKAHYLYLYNLEDIKRYFSLVGSHNFKRTTKLANFLTLPRRIS